MKRTLCPHVVSFALFVFVTLGNANAGYAVTITIDPGPLGDTPSEFDLPFAQLDGTTVSGQSLSLQFLFAESKWIHVFTENPSHGVLLMLRTDNVGPFIQTALPGTGHFLDQNGQSLNGAMQLLFPGGTNNGGLLAASLYSGAEMSQPNPIDEPFRYFGVQYDFTLPSMSNTSVVSAQLRVIRADRISVPETTSSFRLLALGIVALISVRTLVVGRKILGRI